MTPLEIDEADLHQQAVQLLGRLENVYRSMQGSALPQLRERGLSGADRVRTARGYLTGTIPAMQADLDAADAAARERQTGGTQ